MAIFTFYKYFIYYSFILKILLNIYHNNLFNVGIVRAVKGLVKTVMAQAESNRMVLQCMQETQDRNNNHHGEGIRNLVGEALIANPCYQGLYEFRKATPLSFHRDYNLVLAKKQIMQLEKICMRYADSQKVVFASYMLEVSIMVEAHYNFREDSDSIPRKNSS